MILFYWPNFPNNAKDLMKWLNLLENSSNQRVEFKIFKILGELTIEERTLVSASYKNIVGNKRAELRVLTAIE